MVEHLPSMSKALDLIPNTGKKKRKKRRKKKRKGFQTVKKEVKLSLLAYDMTIEKI